MSGAPRILYDARWIGPQGIARFASELQTRIPGIIPLPAGLRLFHLFDPLWLSWAIWRSKPDVYFSPGFNPPARSSTPFVFVIYDLNYVHCQESPDRLRRAYFEYFVKPACKRAARILTVSEYSKQKIIEWAGVSERQVVNVSAAVGPAFSPDGARYSPGFPYVLYVGNRLPHKNLSRLIAAFSRAKTQCKLLVTGKPDEHLSEMAKIHGMEDDLRFAGFVSDEDLPAVYRGAVAVALPSLYEGFGLPVIEAMACGIPVLASTATSLPEIAGDAALLVDPQSIEEIATALKRIVSDGELRDTLRRRGFLQAARFSWDVTAAAVMRELQAVVHGD